MFILSSKVHLYGFSPLHVIYVGRTITFFIVIPIFKSSTCMVNVVSLRALGSLRGDERCTIIVKNISRVMFLLSMLGRVGYCWVWLEQGTQNVKDSGDLFSFFIFVPGKECQAVYMLSPISPVVLLILAQFWHRMVLWT